MLCRQCQQLRQKYLKHTCVEKGRQGAPVSAAGPVCERVGAPGASVVLEERVSGTWNPSHRPDRPGKPAVFLQVP